MVSHNKKVLIDAIYPNEIRVAVLDRGQVVEFDQESKEKKQLKGNIYIGIVKRIEPSLQAVFIEYGPSKHGFLPFSEISLDYYNISEKEKESLLADICETNDNKGTDENKILENNPEYSNEELVEISASDVDIKEVISEESNGEKLSVDQNNTRKDEYKNNDIKGRTSFHRRYRVQDVIKIDQQLMVQITKEGRGNKGASFSTYITLVGRYCIFMPKSLGKSGISRRIEDVNVRKNLKEFLNHIDLPKGSGVIIRTAGENRNAKEIEQDLYYLKSLWQDIKNNYVNSNVPLLLYIEGDIIKRTLRDYCNEDVQEVIISGIKAYELAKACVKFMFKNQLRLRLYKGIIPIFTYYKIEEQILSLYSNKVTLPSGGYMVITPTEALVTIDVNSGRMTGEENIEETAYKTNMEAVKEIARQVNLRGLCGLIVIDFIDMLKYRYCRSVESAIKDAFKHDRARTQCGYISAFGLMEISRQRVKQSILEANTVECIHCKGVGRVRSLESISASVLRDLRYFANKNMNKQLVIKADVEIITDLFNYKRGIISELEKELNVIITAEVENTIDVTDYRISVLGNIDKTYVNSVDDAVNLFTTDYSNKHDKKSITERKSRKVTSGFWLRRWFDRILSNLSN